MNIEEKVMKRIIDLNLKTICVESITGGLIASTMINTAGASSVIEESLIVYSDNAKMNFLNVSCETLKKHTAVSEECVKEMTINTKQIFQKDIVVATTGYADGEFAGKVYIGIAFKNYMKFLKLDLKGDRNTIREEVKNIVFKELDKKLENYLKKVLL